MGMLRGWSDCPKCWDTPCSCGDPLPVRMMAVGTNPDLTSHGVPNRSVNKGCIMDMVDVRNDPKARKGFLFARDSHDNLAVFRISTINEIRGVGGGRTLVNGVEINGSASMVVNTVLEYEDKALEPSPPLMTNVQFHKNCGPA